MMEKIVKETFKPDPDEKKPKKKVKREVKKVDKVIKDKVMDEENDGAMERGAIHYFDKEKKE